MELLLQEAVVTLPDGRRYEEFCRCSERGSGWGGAEECRVKEEGWLLSPLALSFSLLRQRLGGCLLSKNVLLSGGRHAFVDVELERRCERQAASSSVHFLKPGISSGRMGSASNQGCTGRP